MFRRQTPPVSARDAAWRAFMAWLRTTEPASFSAGQDAGIDALVRVRVLPAADS